jgi:hypothetical protein
MTLRLQSEPERLALGRLFDRIKIIHDRDQSATIEELQGRGRSHFAMGWMSDNSSDSDENKRVSRTYKKNPVKWRNGQIGNAMNYLHERAYQFRPQRQPGTAIHRHVNRENSSTPTLPPRNGKGCLYGAPKGFPKNFYDAVWYDGLSREEQDALKVTEPFIWDEHNVFWH